MSYIRLEDNGLYLYSVGGKSKPVQTWGIFLCPMTSRTAETGQWPILVTFPKSPVTDYTAYALVEDPKRLLSLVDDPTDRNILEKYLKKAPVGDGRTAIEIGEAFVESLWPYSVYYRQHMSPGAYIKGVGLGSLLYMLGPLRVAIKEDQPVLDLCTISPHPDVDRHCNKRLGGSKTSDADRWWRKAEEGGFVSTEMLTCEAKDGREEIRFTFEPHFPDEAIKLGVQELIQTPQDLRRYANKYDFDDRPFDLRVRGSKAYIAKGQDFVQRLEGEAYFPSDSPVLLEQALSHSRQKIREEFADVFTGVKDIRIEQVGGINLSFDITLFGTVSHQGKLIYRIEIDRPRTAYAFAIGSFQGTYTLQKTPVFKLCAKDFYRRDDLRLASSYGSPQAIPLAFPDFYANIDPQAISPEFLAFCLEMNDRQDYSNYIEEALEAFRGGYYKPSEEYIQRVRDALSGSGVVMRGRQPNPGRASLRNRHVHRLARQLGQITAGGDG